MYYNISGLSPVSHMGMGRHAFTILLHPLWRELVERSELDQKHIDTMIARMGRNWLDGCGYDRLRRVDEGPEPVGLDSIFAPKTPPPKPEHLYVPERDIKVQWGGWGPEHICVPGNACGLDLSSQGSMKVKGGMVLCPHNIDSWPQKQLLLIIFTEIATTLYLLDPK
jgi:hypothetical protein